MIKNNSKCIIDIETSDFLPWNECRIICMDIINLNILTKHIFYNKEETNLIKSFLRYFTRRKFNIVNWIQHCL